MSALLNFHSRYTSHCLGTSLFFAHGTRLDMTHKMLLREAGGHKSTPLKKMVVYLSQQQNKKLGTWCVVLHIHTMHTRLSASPSIATSYAANSACPYIWAPWQSRDRNGSETFFRLNFHKTGASFSPRSSSRLCFCHWTQIFESALKAKPCSQSLKTSTCETMGKANRAAWGRDFTWALTYFLCPTKKDVRTWPNFYFLISKLRRQIGKVRSSGTECAEVGSTGATAEAEREGNWHIKLCSSFVPSESNWGEQVVAT